MGAGSEKQTLGRFGKKGQRNDSVTFLAAFLSSFLFRVSPHLSLLMPWTRLPAPCGSVEPACQIFPKGIRNVTYNSSIHTDPCSGRADHI